MILILNLIIIGLLANYFGKIAEKLKLPSLIGMMIIGMIIGPSFLDLVSDNTLNIAPILKDISLVIILFIGGLGIDISQIKLIGRPAVLLSILPAILEGFAISFLSMIFLDFNFIQGAILGFIIAAVSPAILIPSMVSLINKNIGQNKAIPQMLLVGASCDDTIAITLFTTFLTIYNKGINKGSISIFSQIIMIPITILLSVLVGFLIFKITKKIISITKNIYLKVVILLIICLSMRFLEKKFNIEVFNSLLSIMIYGFFIRNYVKENANLILDTMNNIWKYGKLYLFTFVGIAINPNFVDKYFFIGFIIISCSLVVRSIGVLLALVGTNLNFKERLFCVIAYIPKATVQSAKASIPLQNGVLGGEIMQAISILSVLITAPIGAIGIKLTSDKLLYIENESV